MASKVNAGNLKKGNFVDKDGRIYLVVETDFNYRGRGSAIVKVKFKDVEGGGYKSFTFKSDDILNLIDVEVRKMQYLYREKETLVFMDVRSFEQFGYPVSSAGEIVNFLKEGEEYYVYFFESKILSIRPPKSVKLQVVETEEAVKGDRVQGAKKPAKVETGITVMVPLFIKKGDFIVINPETGEYIERA